MEKRKSHYRLSKIQAIVVRDGMNAFTATATRNGRDMGLDDATMLATIAGMKGAMFYKSMTTHLDNTLWQDVYHVPLTGGQIAYLKLTRQHGAVVIQFKSKEG